MLRSLGLYATFSCANKNASLSLLSILEYSRLPPLKLPLKRHEIMSQMLESQAEVENPISATLLENLIDPSNEICRLKKQVNWDYLHHKLGHLFKPDHTQSFQLILGFLYLQAIDNLSYSEAILVWEKSAEWQYFCGEKYLNKKFPLLSPSSLSLWGRIIGESGRFSMTCALLSDDPIIRYSKS